MSVALMILLWLFFAVLGLLLAAAFMPFRLELSLRKQEDWRYRVAWRAFGRFSPRVALSNSTRVEKETEEKERGNVRSKWQADPVRIIGAFVRFVSEVVACIRFDAARLDMRFGTGDPAETGQVFGMLTPLIYGTAASPRLCINVEPDFDQHVLRGQAELNLSVIPAHLLAPAARLGWTVFGPGR